MPSVSKINKSTITKYLQANKFRIEKGAERNLRNMYFYGENGDYLGTMTVHPKSFNEVEVSKLIFKEKLKPIFREYTRVKNKMGTFWSMNDKNTDEYLPIGSTTTRVTIDLQNKTQTKTIIERVLEQEPKLIQDVYEKYNTRIYELEGQEFKYKIKSITEETKPYKWNKWHKYNIYV